MARLGERVCGVTWRGGGVFDKRVKKGRRPLGFRRVWWSLFFFKFQFGTFKQLSNWKKKGGRDEDVVETTTL